MIDLVSKKRTMMESDLLARLEEWEELSCKLLNYDMYLLVYSQGLGQLDCELIELDQQMYKEEHNKSFESIFDSNIAIHRKSVRGHILSNLWILGAFEIVRIIGGIEKSNSIQNIKKEFAEIRTPLAKLQRMGGKDSQVARPAWFFDAKGFAWNIENQKKIYRIDLSDKYLQMLQQLPN